jgi:hypothetical protein
VPGPDFSGAGSAAPAQVLALNKGRIRNRHCKTLRLQGESAMRKRRYKDRPRETRAAGARGHGVSADTNACLLGN